MRRLCSCCCIVIVLWCACIGLLFIPTVQRVYLQAIHKHTDAWSFILLNMMAAVPMAGLVGPFGVVDFTLYLDHCKHLGHGGNGLILAPSMNQPGSVALHRCTHAAVKTIHYNPKLERPFHWFIGGNTSKMPAGYFPDGVLPKFLLQLSTDDSERLARRDLIVASMPGLSRYPKMQPQPKAPPGTSAKDLGQLNFISGMKAMLFFQLPSPLKAAVGFSLFRHAFGIELTESELKFLDEWSELLAPLGMGMGSQAGGARAAEIMDMFEEIVSASEFGKGFLKEAAKRGMDGKVRMREMLVIFVFAGYGAPVGLKSSAFQILVKIKSGVRTLVPLFKKDPEAFILEMFRLGFGPSGTNPFVVPETETYSLSTGRVFVEQSGTLGSTSVNQANRDPEVFGGPSKDVSVAEDFRPGRDNADRLLSWVSELRDIRKCPNMTGCESAPRFCLGAELAQWVLREVIGLVVQGIEETAMVNSKDHSSEM